MVQQDPAQSSQRFESDTQKIVRKHLSDPNHVITEEEIANVRIGMTPSKDAPTQQALEEGDSRVADRKADSEDEIVPGAQKSTPWDVLE